MISYDECFNEDNIYDEIDQDDVIIKQGYTIEEVLKEIKIYYAIYQKMYKVLQKKPKLIKEILGEMHDMQDESDELIRMKEMDYTRVRRIVTKFPPNKQRW